MKILAIDTSSSSGSIALMEDDLLLFEWSTGAASQHAVWLMPAIKTLLERSNIDISAIDLFAVTNGPGSFTGLRIGISTVKGLAWPLGAKTLGVSTLAALAMNVPYSSSLVCPVLDARKGEVYAALYDTSSAVPKAVLEDSALTVEALCGRVKALGRGGPVVFIGPGLAVYSGQIREMLPGAVFADGRTIIRAGSVGALALRRAGEAVDPSALAPAYLRKSEAEIKFG